MISMAIRELAFNEFLEKFADVLSQCIGERFRIDDKKFVLEKAIGKMPRINYFFRGVNVPYPISLSLFDIYEGMLKKRVYPAKEELKKALTDAILGYEFLRPSLRRSMEEWR